MEDCTVNQDTHGLWEEWVLRVQIEFNFDFKHREPKTPPPPKFDSIPIFKDLAMNAVKIYQTLNIRGTDFFVSLDPMDEKAYKGRTRQSVTTKNISSEQDEI